MSDDEIRRLEARVQLLERTLHYILGVATDGEVPAALACADIADVARRMAMKPGES